MTTATGEKSTTRVELERDGSVGSIYFRTDAGVPIFSSRVLGELGSLIDQVAEDGALRFVVFRGQEKVFLAGADIQQMSHFTEDQGEAFARHGHRVFDAIATLPQVTIAALNGHAMGGGCELALACDFRVMVASGRIGQPESRLGIIPGWGGTMRLPKLVGDAMARKLMFSGDTIPAEEAYRIGLVDEVVATHDELDAAIDRWFAELASGSPAAIARIKRALVHQTEIEQFASSFSCSDAKEGMSAFLEKRKPAWHEWRSSGKT